MADNHNIVFLNGQFMPISEAKISPMDRGFLFGDGIYEVVPSYKGKLVGFGLHIQRMQDGMNAIGIKLNKSVDDWRDIAQSLIEQNGKGNLGLYFHVSRGADIKRFHAYPDDIEATVFAYAFEIPEATVADKTLVKQFKVASTQDLRWKRCQIKSTSLLGNVMHFQQGHDAGVHETILYNQHNELTEASACNVFIVKNEVVITPPLDNQLLPGITRHMLLDILRKDGTLQVEERVISMNEVRAADELWITSSSKDIAPVVELDGKPVGNGKVGDIWQLAQTLYSANKHNY
ncbi:aminotransferase class IV [Paraglaciecola arctica]|uniref:Aminodeoxychorismate lyase n=1 Tax=Paraglaciecola arctica BSs20135 TaxID=493475 RepID=K6Z9N9_9ALTE|nr:aminotransferase class IV [Paraglaciecola arctica]GAC20170.1 D-alanine transaminase [Paraglaciecola arctica BSs20135]